MGRPADHALQDVGPRVAHAVDAVAEAHQPAPGGELARQPGFGVPVRGDGVQHVQHRARRAAVQGAFQRPDRPDHRRDHPGPSRGDHPGREGRGVHAVLHHRHEVRLEGFHLLVRGRRSAEHPQEVRDVPDRRVGRQRGEAAPGPGDRGQVDRHRARDQVVRGHARLVGQGREAQAQPVDGRQGRASLHQAHQPIVGLGPGRAERSPDGLLGLDHAGQPVPQAGGGRLEGEGARDRLHRQSAHDQPALLAVHLAQHRGRHHHAIQTSRHVTPPVYDSPSACPVSA
ncbi:hypothetical protein D3C72_848680 [compost metagenome]